MNVLLLSMPDIHPSFKPARIGLPGIALHSLAGNIDQKHNVWTGNLAFKRHNVKKAVTEALKTTTPDIVGLSAMSFQYDSALRIAQFIKENYPGIKTALGGYHASLMYEEIAKCEDGINFDFIFRREGEISFNELIHALEQGRDLSAIKGLSYRSGENFIHNPDRSLEDLNMIKLPDRTKRLWGKPYFLGRRSEAIETSRGCLMNCKFCSIRQMYGKSLRHYDTDRIIKDINNARQAGAKSILIVDDNITMDIQRLLEICDAIIASNNTDINFVAQMSCKGVASSEKLVEKMAQAGFKYIFLGIENINDKSLQYLKKGNKSNCAQKAVNLLRKYKMVIIGGIIIGNPDDNEEDIEANYKFLYDNDIVLTIDQILTPYVKTEVRTELADNKLITNADNYKFYNGFFANIKTKHLSSEEIAFYKWKYYMKYMNIAGSLRIFASPLIRYSWPFIIRKFPFELIRQLPGIIRNPFRTEQEKFQQDMKKNLELNKFNI